MGFPNVPQLIFAEVVTGGTLKEGWHESVSRLLFHFIIVTVVFRKMGGIIRHEHFDNAPI